MCYIPLYTVFSADMTCAQRQPYSTAGMFTVVCVMGGVEGYFLHFPCLSSFFLPSLPIFLYKKCWIFFFLRVTVASKMDTHPHSHTQRHAAGISKHTHTHTHAYTCRHTALSLRRSGCKMIPRLGAFRTCLPGQFPHSRPPQSVWPLPSPPPSPLPPWASFLLPRPSLLLINFSQGLRFGQLRPSWLLGLWKTSATHGGLHWSFLASSGWLGDWLPVSQSHEHIIWT